MSNHLSKSLFSIPRLKKSRSRQQNQPENPTSLCLNALTADDAFLRFAAALDKTFFSSRNPERNFIFSLYMHPPSAAARGSRAALQYFQSYRPSLHHTGHIFTLHAEYIQRSCPKCVAPRRNGEIFQPANATAATHRGAGTAIQDEYKKKPYPSARRGIYYTGIIGGGMGGRGYNNMEIWDGRERAGDIIIWKYMTAERRRGR